MTQKQSENQEKKLRFFGIPVLKDYAVQYRKEILCMVLLGILSSLADTIYPLFNRYALNHFVLQSTLDTLLCFILFYALVLALQVICNFTSSYLISRVELYIGRDLKNASFSHLQTLSFSYFNTHHVGYLHSRIMSDTDRIATVLSWQLMDFVWNVSYIVFAFLVMLRIRASLALYLLLLLPVAGIFISFFQKKLLRANREVREMNAVLSSDYNEGITGARTIRTLGVSGRISRDFARDSARMRKLSIHAKHYSALFTASVTLLSSVALALVLSLGGRLTGEALLEIGSLSVFMSYALGMMEPIQFIIQATSSLLDVQVNIERLMKLLHTRSDVEDTPEVIEKYGDSFEPKRENWEKLEGEVEFRDVSFHYPDGTEMVLEHFDLKVPRGANIAIVGETGAGKSTLVNLVCRFFEPTGGKLLIDGRDVRERSQLWLHSNLGYVLQTPHLFSGSVRENLRYGKEDATDEEIWQALRMVGADDVVLRMGHGLDSEVGEGGELLSTGEKQLLSFARAILSDPAILVLDEATSSIDTVTEKKIRDAIRTVTDGRTAFIIAHRLSTIADADRILAVVDGKIVESGTHQELMTKRGYYYRLYTRQFAEQETEKLL